jgi:hypothetical protein
MRRPPLVLTLALALATPHARVGAQSFAFFPNGEAAFFTDLTTSGVFSCNPALVNATCTARDNTLLFGWGESTLHLTFNGIADPNFVVTNRRRPVTIGTIESVLTGPASPLPTPFTSPWFSLALTLTSTEPAASAQFLAGYFFAPPFLPRAVGPLSVELPAANQQPNLNYSGSVFIINAGFIDTRTGSIPVTATVGIVPEPSTIVLVGTGLLAVFGVSTRQRRARRAS